MPKKSSLLDQKDRKILSELDKNARQTDTQMGKKVGLSKQVVNYRIQKLIERGIISNFYTIINTGLLGLNSYYLFLQLEKINGTQESELMKKINALGYVGWLVSGTGRWDAVALIYAGSPGEFDALLTEIITLCGDHLHEYQFTALVHAEHLGYKFLAEKEIFWSVKKKEKKTPTILELTDKKILAALSQNSRRSLVEVSQITKIPTHKIHYHLKKLIKLKLIEGFKPKIDLSVLGYQWHLLLLQFRSTTEKEKKEFFNFCRYYKKIYYATHTVGQYNFMLDIHVHSMEEFKEVLLELKSRFSGNIHLYESIIIFKEHKIDYFPIKLL